VISSVSRIVTRVGAGAAGVLVGGLLASPASAAAAGADLAVNLAGTTIAATAAGKFGTVTLTNNGPDAATGVVLTFDTGDLDTSKVVAARAGCTTTADAIVCAIGDDSVPPAGGDLDFSIPLDRVPGAPPGPAGTLSVTVSADTDDPNPGNNDKTADVVIGDSGVDLHVLVPDVYGLDAAGDPTTDPVPAGGSSEVHAFFINFGDMGVDGLRVVVTLPEFVTFGGVDPACTYSPDNRSATCDYDVVITPDEGIDVAWPVTVAANAPGPKALRGGLVAGAAIAVFDPPLPDGPSALPKNIRKLSPDQVPDVDPGDDEDAFTVFIGAGPGQPGPGDLPVTGVRIGQFGALGAALVVLGAMLVVLARRRRRAS